MADQSSIEWTDATWNPITGCSIVSTGCRECYAMRLAGTRLQHHPSRSGLTKVVNGAVVWTGEVRFNEQWLMQPLQWTRPRKIFVCAHGDLFHENVPDEWIDKVFAVMALSPQHTFQILTKRSARMRQYLSWRERAVAWFLVVDDEFALAHDWPLPGKARNVQFLPNVWLGVTAEDQPRADERIPDLLATPAAVRFVSYEPALGPVDFRRIRIAPDHHTILSALDGYWRNNGSSVKLDWVIAGGESGPNARPAHPDWFRSVRDQCKAASVPFHFKQWGGWRPLGSIDNADDDDLEAIIDADQRRSAIICSSGTIWRDDDGQPPLRSWMMERCGKKAAGRKLDGLEHNGAPAAGVL